MTAGDLITFAKDHTIRSCKLLDIDYIGSGGQFCSTDASSITPDYDRQYLYVTTATSYKPGTSYSVEFDNGGSKETKTFDQPTSASDGMPLTLYVYVPMDKAGTYNFTFKENGSEISHKSVSVTSPA